ncbi:hypothetical protein CRE_26877 [Caenorhabditis remanei]|uniref:Up-regulated in Daf-2 domain-containing protein n=1 Tax=Caenorhabditis remanei TaxID=31234 RepID=E3NQ91_CAERE|nr:hypothetical protein CRE_26877 [Caenorhabditis remanei]
MSSDPAPPQATRRSAKIDIDNQTGTNFRFKVQHQYTGWETDVSKEIIYKPDEKKTIFDNVEYNTGFLTTGVDNWIVEGTKLNQETVNGKKELVDGAKFQSGTGALASWKVHTLTAEDDGKTTVIRVFPTEIHFISESGKSTTAFTVVKD